MGKLLQLLTEFTPAGFEIPMVPETLAALQPETAHWDRATARALLRLSDLAYGGEAEVRAFFTSAAACGWTLAETFHRSLAASLLPVDTDGFVAFHAASGQAAVCFRGSQPDLSEGISLILDWWTNFRVTQVAPDPTVFTGVQGRIHQGFFDGWSSARGIVRALLDQFPGGSRAIRALWCTGHSLGGALATVAAADLVDEFPQQTSLWTYAQPRVGDPVFAKWLDEALAGRYHRVVNADDLVTHLPPSRFTTSSGTVLEFTHAGTEQRISPERAHNAVSTILSLLPGASVTERPSLGTLFAGMLDGKALHKPVMDHIRSVRAADVSGYYQNLL